MLALKLAHKRKGRVLDPPLHRNWKCAERQTAKLLPQPQELLACGFLIENEDPIMSST